MISPTHHVDIDHIRPSTECYKCFKLDLCCESFESSSVQGRCLRCNHQEHDHRLESGSSTRPFPLLLYSTAKLQHKEQSPQSKSARGPNHFAGNNEIITENTALRAELLSLQADLKAARSLIQEMTTGASFAPPNAHHGFFLDTEVNKTISELDQALHTTPEAKGQDNKDINPQNPYKWNKPISLSNRLRENLAKPQTSPETGKKSLMKNISRHTLITRGFIHSHFEKLEGQANTGRMNVGTLFNTLMQIQKDLLKTLQWIQSHCFEAFIKEHPQFVSHNEEITIIQEFLPPLIQAESEVLRCLSCLAFDQHKTMREMTGSVAFKELVEMIRNALTAVVHYGKSFPTMQCTLEEIMRDPTCAKFFKEKQREIRFSESLMLPLHHPSNYVQFYSEAMELLNVGSPAFKKIVGYLSDATSAEKEVCSIIHNFSNIASAVRSQRELFSKGTFVYDPNRLLIREQVVMLYHAEKIDVPFFQRFKQTKLYVFSDSIVLGTSKDDESDRIIFSMSSLITVHENPRGVCKFPIPEKSNDVLQVLESSFLLVTVNQSFFVTCNDKIDKLDTVEDILSTFRDFARANVKNEHPLRRSTSFASLNGNMFYAE